MLCENGRGERGLGMVLQNPIGSSWEQLSKDRGDGNWTRGLYEGPQSLHPRKDREQTVVRGAERGRGGTVATHPLSSSTPPPVL